MNKAVLPLLEYLNAETAIKIRRGLYLLSKIDVESQEKKFSSNGSDMLSAEEIDNLLQALAEGEKEDKV